MPEVNAPDPLRLIPPLHFELLQREYLQLRELGEQMASWLRDNAVEKHLRVETAVIDERPYA